MAPEVSLPPSQPTERIVGRSPAIQALREQIRHLASFDAVGKAAVPTLLLCGETGTGKGLIARVAHDSGPRARGPFVEVNCAAIPETLLEAEVFGFEAGAFTDAKRAKPGLFEAASGGTLFLDEIDALPLPLQSKFLKAIEEKRVRRLGAVAEHAVDIKLIAATQAELSGYVHERRFRADLYHRLAVVMLELPPLRARGEDILVLARHYLRRYAEVHGLAPVRLSGAAEAWLLSYDWPGNIRELSHLMERLMLVGPEAVLEPSTLERLCLPRQRASTPSVPLLARGRESVDESARIEQALRQTGGNVVRAARLLGLGRGALRHRMRRYGIGGQSSENVATERALQDEEAPQPRGGVGIRRVIEDPQALVPAWELKAVAVLAIDLTFPRAAEFEARHYEPRTAMTQWERAIVEKVEGFGGILLQRAPSLLTVAFGIPRALEQMPQRAVQAALAIRSLLTEAPPPDEGTPCPEVRLAVHLGAVSVDARAIHLTEQLLAVGDTLALPVRLLGHAAPGEILASPPVGRLVEGRVELRARPVLLGPETADRIEAYSITGLRRSPLPGLGVRALSRFVGRERELPTLLDLLAQVEGGQGQVVGIVGEPGMGKSRLLYEFRQCLAGKPITYVEGQCLAYGRTIPYLPVLDLVRNMCAITEADRAEAIAEKVCRNLQGLEMDPQERAPYLLQLLGIKEGTDRLSLLTPEAVKVQTVETLRQVILHSSRRQSLLLAVENLHWIDQSSEDLLASLVESLIGGPILLLSTYRPGYRPPWIGKSFATQLALRPLSPRDSLSVLQSAFHTEQVPDALAQVILGKAEGNPFFLEELAQAAVEQPTEISTLTVPDTIQGVLMARIDRLPAEPKRLLQTASVLGRRVPLGLLTAIWEEPSSLNPSLLELRRSEFLYEQAGADGPVYVFKHALIQDVAYQTLTTSQQRGLHERVGRAIEHLWGRLEEHYEELAHHFCHGEIWEKTFEYALKSGNKAKAIFANREAIHFYTVALEAAGRIAPPLGDDQLMPLYERRGQVWSLLTNYDASVMDFEALLERARHRGDRHREGEALCHLAHAHWLRFSEAYMDLVERYAREALGIARETGDEQILARSLASLAFVDQSRGRLGEADRKLEESLAIARRNGYKGTTPATLAWLGAHANWRGEFRRVIDLCMEGMQVAREVQDGFYELHTLSFLCLAHAGMGEWDLAFASLHEGMAKAHEWDNRYFIARFTNSLGWFHHELGDFAGALEYDQAGYELGRASKVSNTEISALINLGLDHLYLEQMGTARRLLEETLDRVEREAFGSHRWRWKIRLCIGLGRLWSLEQDPGKAMQFLDDGLRLALDTGSQKYVAEGRALRGELLMAGGRVAEGLHELQEGLALAETLPSPALTWRLAQSLGRAHEQRGNTTQALDTYTMALNAVMAAAGRIGDRELRERFLASPQAAVLRDDLGRLGRVGG